MTSDDSGRHTCAVADWLYARGLAVVFVEEGRWWLATPAFVAEVLWGRVRPDRHPLASRCHTDYHTATRVTDCPWCGSTLAEEARRDL